MKDLRPELELVRGAAAGDDRTWRELVGLTCHRLFALLCYQVGNREEALDLLQETYLQAFRHLHEFRGEAPLEAWLHTIALRKAMDWKRSWRRRLRRTAPLRESLAASPVPTEDLQFDTERAAWNSALATLTGIQRAVFLLREADGCSFAEIGRALGCKEGTARVHHLRARERLRRKLRGGPLDRSANEDTSR